MYIKRLNHLEVWKVKDKLYFPQTLCMLWRMAKKLHKVVSGV